ncbi:TPA: contractile injection system protein, VgrG/Pvc8 family [Escherichia coli]
MALPRKLKHLNLFNDGNNWQGIVESLTLPKFTRKYEKYRGGGMPGAVDVDLGLDDSALDTEFSIGGTELLLFKQMGKNGGRAAVVNFSSELLNKGNKTPAFSISIEGRDITTVLDNCLMGLTLTDNRGFEADQLDLELDDADGKIVLPRRGAVITLALGWKGQPLFPKGAFTVDEIEHTGAPDRLTIRARSADFRETLNTRREKSWHKTTVGEVVKEIAARHKLKMALGKDLSDKPVDHIDQTNESDGSFLMRLARQYGAIASVKNGNLLFIRQGQGKSASGKPLPVITITRKDGDSHRFTLADRGAYTGVIASWLHTREPAKKESTTVKRKRRTKKQKKEPEAKQGDYLVGTDENVLVLNRTYANRSNAERAAKMQWERLQRGVASFSLQLAEGRADLYTEMPVKVSGFKQPIDDAEWTITTLTHTVSPDNGFTTSIELEVKIDDFEME